MVMPYLVDGDGALPSWLGMQTLYMAVIMKSVLSIVVNTKLYKSPGSSWKYCHLGREGSKQ